MLDKIFGDNLDPRKVVEVVDDLWEDRSKIIDSADFVWDHRDDLIKLIQALPDLLDRAGDGIAAAGASAVTAGEFLSDQSTSGARGLSEVAAAALDRCTEELSEVLSVVDGFGRALGKVNVPGADDLVAGASRIGSIANDIGSVADHMRGLGHTLGNVGDDLGRAGERLADSGTTLQAFASGSVSAPAKSAAATRRRPTTAKRSPSAKRSTTKKRTRPTAAPKKSTSNSGAAKRPMKKSARKRAGLPKGPG